MVKCIEGFLVSSFHSGSSSLSLYGVKYPILKDERLGMALARRILCCVPGRLEDSIVIVGYFLKHFILYLDLPSSLLQYSFEALPLELPMPASSAVALSVASPVLCQPPVVQGPDHDELIGLLAQPYLYHLVRYGILFAMKLQCKLKGYGTEIGRVIHGYVAEVSRSVVLSANLISFPLRISTVGFNTVLPSHAYQATSICAI